MKPFKNNKKVFNRPAGMLLRLGLSVFLLSAILFELGCANVSYRRITTKADDEAGEGIRYYDTSPYILVQRDTNSNWATSVLYLADHTKQNQANAFSFLAVNNTSLVFTNGVMTDSTAATDSSAVPAAIVQAAAQVALTATKAVSSNPALIESTSSELGEAERVPITLKDFLNLNPMEINLTKPTVFLFKIVKVNHDWGLVGASAPDLDRVDVNAAK
jgi:hypothetical protein